MAKAGFSWLWVSIPATIAAVALVTLTAPLEQTLGINMRMIYLHGTWVWASLVLFATTALLAAAWLVKREEHLYHFTVAASRIALLFWLLYLPQSLMVMKANWGGFYFSEPRWQVPMTFVIIGGLLYIGLALVNNRLLTAGATILYTLVLFWRILSLQSVLHPDSPIQQSNSITMQLFFLALFLLIYGLGIQVSVLLYQQSRC